MVTIVREEFPLAVPVDAVLARLADGAFVERRTAANSILRGEVVEHTADAGTIVIRTVATVPLDWLPPVVAGRGPTAPTVTREEVWDQARGGGTMRFDITGVPASANGSMRLDPDPSGAGAVLSYRVELSVSMPFVGGLVEKAVATQIRRSLQAEAECFGD